MTEETRPTNRLLDIYLWCDRNNAPEDVKEALKETSQYIQRLEALRHRVGFYVDNTEGQLATLLQLYESVED